MKHIYKGHEERRNQNKNSYRLRDEKGDPLLGLKKSQQLSQNHAVEQI